MIVLTSVAVLVALSVSFTGRYTLEVVDAGSQPQLAYGLYHHKGDWLSVHPVSYDATEPRIVKTDSAGGLTIPAAVHLHLPFPVQTPPKLWIEMVYVPRLHNAYGRVAGGDAISTAGTWEMDRSGRRAVVFDLSDSPERWQGTLANLSFFIGHLVSAPALRRDGSATAPLIELIGHFRGEYNAFLARHGDTRRPRPPMPAGLNDDERRRWNEMVDQDLTERPTWGMEIRRRFETELKSLAGVEAGMKR